MAEDDAMYIHCFSRRKDVVGTLKVATVEATHTVIMARMWIRAKEINCTMQVSNPATTITSGEWSNPPSEFLKKIDNNNNKSMGFFSDIFSATVKVVLTPVAVVAGMMSSSHCI